MTDAAATACGPQSSTTTSAVRFTSVMALTGGLALAAGLVLESQRTWANVLLLGFYLVGLGLAGLIFLALQYVTGAAWSAPLRPTAETMTKALPLGGVALFAVWLCRPSLYPWMVSGPGESAASDFQQFWLQRPFFLLRAVVYLGSWLLLARAIIATARRADVERAAAPALRRRNVLLSAVALVVLGITIWLASYDWIMSLEPEWSSTVFGPYHFAGIVLSGLAAIILLADRAAPGKSPKPMLATSQWHDLGKLLFGFATFWAYLWYCQYMLIWYVNNPEETAYFTARLHGTWQPLFWTNAILNWAVPFVVLLPRWTKCHPGVLRNVAVAVLLGRWLDLYLMILPTVSDQVPAYGLGEAATLLFAASIFSKVADPRPDTGAA